MTELTSRLKRLTELIIENQKLNKRLNTLKYYDTSKLKKARDDAMKCSICGEVDKSLVCGECRNCERCEGLIKSNEKHIRKDVVDEMVNRLILDFDLTKEDVKQVRKLAEEMNNGR